MTAHAILFLILAFVSVVTALCVVIAHRPIYCLLALIALFFSIAGHYILLAASFLAMVTVIVYAGAIMVLFLFALMLMNIDSDAEPRLKLGAKIGAVFVSGVLMLSFLVALNSAQPAQGGNTASEVGTAKSLGTALFSDYLLPFELSSILFLTATVGAVFLGKKENA